MSRATHVHQYLGDEPEGMVKGKIGDNIQREELHYLGKVQRLEGGID
jgi:hypothetical protein